MNSAEQLLPTTRTRRNRGGYACSVYLAQEYAS